MADQHSTPLPPTCKVILANNIAKKLLGEVAEGLKNLEEQGVQKPKLVGLLANDDPAARMYADWSRKTCVEK